MVETSSTGLGSVVDNARVEDLPLNGRVANQLIFLAGMSQPGAQSSLVTQRNYPTQLAIAVAGGSGENVNYMLDGVNHTDAQNYQSFVMPFPDALQEFKVETSALPAQYGYHWMPSFRRSQNPAPMSFMAIYSNSSETAISTHAIFSRSRATRSGEINLVA